MSNLESRIAKIADAVGQIPEGGDYAQDLYKILADMSAHLIERRHEAYMKYQGAYTKWLDFYNGSIEAERAGVQVEVDKERARIVRLIISSSHWRGGYQALLDLLETEASR